MSNFRIRWLENEADPRYVPIPTASDPLFQFTIIDDGIQEDRLEYFEVHLSSNHSGQGGNAIFYPHAVGYVMIVDDDTRK